MHVLLSPRLKAAGVAAVAVLLASAGCSSDSSPGASPPSGGASFGTLAALEAELSTAGIPCAGVNPLLSRSLTDTSGIVDTAQCSSPAGGASSNDTILVLFDSHYDAAGWQSAMVERGIEPTGEVVIGPDWGIYTTTAYGTSIVAKLGGTAATNQSVVAP